jgi:hypothetical protein
MLHKINLKTEKKSNLIFEISKNYLPIALAGNTQVENYGPVSAGKYRKSLEHGSSILTGHFSDFFR